VQSSTKQIRTRKLQRRDPEADFFFIGRIGWRSTFLLEARWRRRDIFASARLQSTLLSPAGAPWRRGQRQVDRPLPITEYWSLSFQRGVGRDLGVGLGLGVGVEVCLPKKRQEDDIIDAPAFIQAPLIAW